jgi:hypothetical protein
MAIESEYGAFFEVIAKLADRGVHVKIAPQFPGAINSGAILSVGGKHDDHYHFYDRSKKDIVAATNWLNGVLAQLMEPTGAR